MGLKVLQQRKKRDTLKVRARGDAMVADHARLEHPTHPTRAFVGRVFDRSLAIPGESEGGWRPTIEAQEVSADTHYQYILAIVHGDLWAADEATAKRASEMSAAKGMPAITFDPAYGGELQELEDWLGDRAADAKANAKPEPEAVKPSAPVASAPAGDKFDPSGMPKAADTKTDGAKGKV